MAKKTHIAFRAAPKLVEDLKRMAGLKRWTFSATIVYILEEYFKKHEHNTGTATDH